MCISRRMFKYSKTETLKKYRYSVSIYMYVTSKSVPGTLSIYIDKICCDEQLTKQSIQGYTCENLSLSRISIFLIIFV